jgi:hypothetical protein
VYSLYCCVTPRRYLNVRHITRIYPLSFALFITLSQFYVHKRYPNICTLLLTSTYSSLGQLSRSFSPRAHIYASRRPLICRSSSRIRIHAHRLGCRRIRLRKSSTYTRIHGWGSSAYSRERWKPRMQKIVAHEGDVIKLEGFSLSTRRVNTYFSFSQLLCFFLSHPLIHSFCITVE